MRQNLSLLELVCLPQSSLRLDALYADTSMYVFLIHFTEVWCRFQIERDSQKHAKISLIKKMRKKCEIVNLPGGV